MTWIIFDEADHYSAAPHFCLPSLQGQVCLQDYHERCSLVLVFMQDFRGKGRRAGLEEFAARRDEYLDEDAKILAVFPESLDSLEPGETNLDLPFPLLFDEKRAARSMYAGLMDASLVKDDEDLVFVLDRYSAPYAAWIGKDFSDPKIHKEIQSWLSYIGIQCPE